MKFRLFLYCQWDIAENPDLHVLIHTEFPFCCFMLRLNSQLRDILLTCAFLTPTLY